MESVIIACITALTGSGAWAYYNRAQKQRIREREALIIELRAWRDDWRERAEDLEEKVTQLCLENGLLRAQIERLETQIKTLKK